MKKTLQAGQSDAVQPATEHDSLLLRLYRTLARGIGGRGLGLHRFAWLSRLHEQVSKKVIHDGIRLIDIDGQKLYVKADSSHIANSLLTLGVWEKLETDIFLSLIKPHMTVVDVGAHIGYYTLLAAKRVRQVYSFEPDPDTFQLLTQSVQINGYSNVSCFQSAVSDKTGRAKFHVDSEAWANSLCSDNVGSPVAHLEVGTVSLDDLYVSGALGDCVHLIKIDAQGAETLVLDGAEKVLSDCRPIVLLEVEPDRLHNMGSNSADLLRRLEPTHHLQAIEAPELSSVAAIISLAEKTLVINVVALPRD